MPNTPSLVQEGATVYSKGHNCKQEDGQIIEQIFKAVGPACVEVPEAWIDAVTGISGSGPAYMYIIIGRSQFCTKARPHLSRRRRAYSVLELTRTILF